jgi:hypothetical protein
MKTFIEYIKEDYGNHFLYHGSNNIIDKFLFSKIGDGSGKISNYYGHGIYFTDDINYAKKYGTHITTISIDKDADILSDVVTPEQVRKVYEQLKRENVEMNAHERNFYENPTYGEYSVLTDVLEFRDYIERTNQDKFYDPDYRTVSKNVSEFLLRSGIDGMMVVDDMGTNNLIVYNENVITVHR